MRKRKTLGNLEVILQQDSTAPAVGEQLAARQRIMVANFCKTLGGARQKDAVESNARSIAQAFTPRVRQTLDRIMVGDSEKQIALQLGVSQNTAHVYVKTIYRAFNVSSRGELMTHFISPRWQPDNQTD